MVTPTSSPIPASVFSPASIHAGVYDASVIKISTAASVTIALMQKETQRGTEGDQWVGGWVGGCAGMPHGRHVSWYVPLCHEIHVTDVTCHGRVMDFFFPSLPLSPLS